MTKDHECRQEETIGKMKEFMESIKGFKATLFTIACAILIQVGTFLYLWGGLTTVVNRNDDDMRNKIAPSLVEHTRNIDRIMAKLDGCQLVYAKEQ